MIYGTHYWCFGEGCLVWGEESFLKKAEIFGVFTLRSRDP